MGKEEADEKRGPSTAPGRLGAISVVSGNHTANSTLVTVDRSRGKIRKSKPYGQMAFTTLVGPAQLAVPSAEPAYQAPQMPPDASDSLRQTHARAKTPLRRTGVGKAGVGKAPSVSTSDNAAAQQIVPLPLANNSSGQSVTVEVNTAAISANLARARTTKIRRSGMPTGVPSGVPSGMKQQTRSRTYPSPAEPNVSPPGVAGGAPSIAGGAPEVETTYPRDWYLVNGTPTTNTIDRVIVVAPGSPTTNAPSGLAVDASAIPSSAHGAAAQVGVTAGGGMATMTTASEKALDEAPPLRI